jgi:predicted TIM-barrel enzyme
MAGGADLIVVYNTGRTRLMGLMTTHLLNHANPTTISMFGEIENVVDTSPIIGGAEASDPAFMDLHRLVDAFRGTGFDGLINFPTVGPFTVPDRDLVGLGRNRDEDMVRLARESDFFTMGYAYSPEQAIGLVRAGVDVIVPHAGWTTGGLSGAGQAAKPLEDSCRHVQAIIDASRSERNDVIALAHGGSISSPEDTYLLYEQTDAQGFLGASSIERVPIERAVLSTVAAYQSVGLQSRVFTPARSSEGDRR